MNRIQRVAVFSAVSAALLAGPALAQYQDDHRDNHDQSYHNDADHHDHYVRHDDWRRGYRMRHEDWDRGEHVDDWQAHHLRRPPRGYEWRSIDGNYVMARTGDGRINAIVTIR